MLQHGFDSGGHVVLVGQRNSVSDLVCNDIARPAVTGHDRHGAHRKCLEDHAASKLAQGREEQHIRSP
jgi:hypothetical protein